MTGGSKPKRGAAVIWWSRDPRTGKLTARSGNIRSLTGLRHTTAIRRLTSAAGGFRGRIYRGRALDRAYPLNLPGQHVGVAIQVPGAA